MKLNRLLKICFLVLFIAASTEEMFAQKRPYEPSPEERAIYDGLYDMMFSNPKGGQTNLKSTDDILICVVKDLHHAYTDKHLGDAIFIEERIPDNRREYEELKKGGQKPNPTKYPVRKVYMIPLRNGKTQTRVLFSVALMEFDFHCFKWETYPERFCEFYAAGTSVSWEDSERYFDFKRSGWVSWRDYNDRCGLTKQIALNVVDAKIVLDFMAGKNR